MQCCLVGPVADSVGPVADSVGRVIARVVLRWKVQVLRGVCQAPRGWDVSERAESWETIAHPSFCWLLMKGREAPA